MLENETISVTTADGKFTINILLEFLEKYQVSHPRDVSDLIEWCCDYGMAFYLHNINGPAIVRHKDSKMEYWTHLIGKTDSSGRKCL